MSRYRWYALSVLMLAQTCHALDRSIIGLVLGPVGWQGSLMVCRSRSPPFRLVSRSVDTRAAR
jgi:hypothetical protein